MEDEMIKQRIARLEKDFQPPKHCAVVILRPGESTEDAVARHIAEVGSDPSWNGRPLVIID